VAFNLDCQTFKDYNLANIADLDGDSFDFLRGCPDAAVINALADSGFHFIRVCLTNIRKLNYVKVLLI